MSRGVIGYKIPMFLSNQLFNPLEKKTDKLLSLLLKVCKEQELCAPGNKVLIFESENEGKQGESLTFRLLGNDGE